MELEIYAKLSKC